MGVAKAFLLTYDTSGNITYRKAVNNILSATLSKDGERVVDSLTIQLPANVSTGSGSPPSTGNGIYYVQDIADTTFLSGIWNMHYNILDESGFDLDATSTNEAITMYSADTGTRFNGHIIRAFAVTGDELSIADPASRAHDQLTGPLLSFAGMFDFFVWIQCSDTTSATKFILDREDNTTGISIYISGGSTGVIKVDKWISGTQSNMVTGSVQVNDGNWHLIRVNRDSSNNVNLYVDNNVDGTPANYSTSLQNNTPHFIIGNNSASAGARKPFIGNMFQARFYSGGILNSTDATTVYNYKPQPYTMKFGGTVWQVTNNVDNKQLQCNGFSQILGNINLRLTGSSDTPTSYNNVYTSSTPKAILSDIVTNWFPGWKLVWIPSAGSSISKYIATGSLLQNMVALLYTVSPSITFWTNARRVLYVETLGYDRTDAGAFDKGSLTFIGTQQGGKYDITENGTDTSVYINDLTFVGNNDLLSYTDSFASNGTTYTTTYPPENTNAYVNGVQVSISSVNLSTKSVVLSTSYADDNSGALQAPTVSGGTGSTRYTFTITYNNLAGLPIVVSKQATITNGQANSSLSLTVSGWQAMTGVNSYSVLMDQDAALSISTHGTAGTTHDTYLIIPKNTYGRMLASQPVTITTANATLSSSNYNVLSWTAVPGAASYDILVNYNSGTTPTSTCTYYTNTSSTSYNDEGISSGTPYGNTYQTASALINSVSVATSPLQLALSGNYSSLSAYNLDNPNGVPTLQNALVTLSYQYEGIALSTPSKPYGKVQDNNAIALFGDYSKTITNTGYYDVTQGQAFAANYFLRYSNNINTNSGASVTWTGSVGALSASNSAPALEQHITINAGSLVNCIRENMKVGVVAGIQGSTYSTTFGQATGSSYSPIAQIIKSFTYTFPQGQTSIVVGDFVYDMYDTTVAQAGAINQATQQYTTVKNV